MRSGQLANALLRVAGAAAGVALTLRLSDLPDLVGPAEVGLLGLLYAATDLLAAIPAGVLSDRWGRRPLLLGGAAAGAAGLLLAGVTAAFPLLALGRVIQGFGTGATVPPLLGWFSDVTAGRSAGRRGRVMAGVEAGTAAGLLGGTVLGSVVWGVSRAVRAPLLGFCLLALLYLAASWLLARVPSFADNRGLAARPVGQGWSRTLRTVLRTPGLPRLLVAWVLLNSVVGLWLTHAVYQLNAVERDGMQFLVGIGRYPLSLLGRQVGALQVILLLWTLLFIGGSLAWGPLLGRVRAWRAMRIALAGMLLVCAALVFLNAGWAPAAVRWLALPVFCAGVVLEAGFAPAALSQLAVDASAAHRGLIMGLYSVALGLGTAIGNGLGTPFSAAWAMNGIIGATALLAATALAVITVRTSGETEVHGERSG